MKKKQAPRAGAGRPTLYTVEIADKICDDLIEGNSLRTICSQPGHPNRSTVMRWLDEQPDFAAKHARARLLQADYMDDKILDTADACTIETANADRVKIGAYQWRAERLEPKKYGARSALALTDGDGGPVKILAKLSDAELAILEAILAKANGGSEP